MQGLDKQGNLELYAEIYQKYLSGLYRYATLRVTQKEDREDLLSQVFVDVFESLKNGKEIKNIKAFLYQALHNRIVDYYKTKSRTREAEVSLDAHIEGESVTSSFKEATHEIDASLEYRKVMALIEGLRDEYKEIIRLRFIEELEIGEIALVLSRSQVGVRVMLHRALKALKQAYEKSRAGTNS